MARIEKELADYQSQADRPFEHEERLKQLLARQAEINSLLDLDKGDQQGADSGPGLKDDPEVGRASTPAPRGRDEVAKMAEAYMRDVGNRHSGNAHLRAHTAANRSGNRPCRCEEMKRTSPLRQRLTASSSCRQRL